MNTQLFQDLCRQVGDWQPSVMCVWEASLATERVKDVGPNLSILSSNSDVSIASQSSCVKVSVWLPCVVRDWRIDYAVDAGKMLPWWCFFFPCGGISTDPADVWRKGWCGLPSLFSTWFRKWLVTWHRNLWFWALLLSTTLDCLETVLFFWDEKSESISVSGQEGFGGGIVVILESCMELLELAWSILPLHISRCCSVKLFKHWLLQFSHKVKWKASMFYSHS